MFVRMTAGGNTVKYEKLRKGWEFFRYRLKNTKQKLMQMICYYCYHLDLIGNNSMSSFRVILNLEIAVDKPGSAYHSKVCNCN